MNKFFKQSISKEIFETKYCLNGEQSVEEVLAGVAKDISLAETTTEKQLQWEKKFYDEMISERLFPAGRILANARPDTKMRYYNNCYTIGVDDSIEDIYQSLANDAKISSTGGGVGMNISKLRYKGCPISKGGESSGVVSFLEVFDQSAKIIHTGGGRRSAHIAILDITHPEIENFITCKRGDENKKLTQFNISVGITDAFIAAVEQDADWDLIFNGEVIKTVKAKYLFNLITENSFQHNERGVFNRDTVEKYNNGWYGFKMDGVNPCGEICMPPYSVCCLSSINLPAFVKNAFTKEAYFDMPLFMKTISTGVRFLDNVLDRTEYPLPIIQQMSKDWRRIGLGFTGLADMFVMLCMPYGSSASKELSERIANMLRVYSYWSSVDLAKEKGAFPKFDFDKIAAKGFVHEKTWPDELLEDMAKYGLRNVGINTTAPVGTTSLSLGNNCSSGIEPIFSLEYVRRIRQSADTDDVKEETVYDKAWLDYQCLDENFGKEVKAPEYFTTIADVSIDDGLVIQAIFQNHIDHSISKTLNLPPGTTLKEYQDIYLKAYHLGLKGLTTFNPEGSMKGILEVSNKNRNEEGEIKYHEAPARPKDLQCDIHEITVNKAKMLFVVGLYNGMPYEIFIETNSDRHIDCEKHKSGIIRKRKRGCYDLIIEDQVIAADLSHTFDENYLSMARMLSMSLRHGVPLQFIVSQLGKDSRFGSFQKGVSRVLKSYITEGEEVKSREKSECPECGSPLVFQDGCISCSNLCGWSKCG